MAQNIESYLSNFRVKKGEPFTHTSVAGGSFAIPDSARPHFLKHYKTALLSNGAIPLHITEKHMSVSPLLIDLDFRQTSDKRCYDQDFIFDFLELYTKYVYDHVDTKDDIVYYVLEKGDGPRFDEKKGVYKDGLHIIAPYIVTQPEIQESIRDCFINNETDVFAKLGLCNPIEDIIDSAVIKTNNWFMYGSNKPTDGDNRYLATFKVNVNKNLEMEIEIQNNESNESNEIDVSLVELLSIHTTRPECKYTVYGSRQLKLRTEGPKEDEAAFQMSSVSCQNKETLANLSIRVLSDVELACALVDILSDERAKAYDSWLNLGICLYNIDPDDDALLNKWIEFSKKAPQYLDDINNGICEEKWESFEKRENGLSLGTLRMWAKKDNPQEYAKIVQNNMLHFVSKAASGTHTDIANVVYQMYGHLFRCVGIKQGIWYQFRDHRWHLVEQAYKLRQLISTEVFTMFVSMAEFLQKKSSAVEDQDLSVRLIDKAIKFNEIARKLKSTGFKDSIVKECAELCKEDNFQAKLDARPELLVFKNGVFDLDEFRFREGLPEDYASFTTDYDYTPIIDQRIRANIMKFIGDITINEDNANYLLKICAYMLHGTKYMEQFWFFTGRGRNGKGTLCTLLEKSLGTYYYEPDISIVTSMKKSSSGANPEMAKAKGKRILCASEPDDEDSSSKFRVSKLKQLRGNDLIQARGLFSDFIEFRPQFGMIFQMNDKPELSKADDAIGKTLKIIEFPYQFVDNPTQEYERLANPFIKTQFERDIRYRQQFMLILLDYYKEYVHGCKTIREPVEVMRATKEYMEENNHVAVWLKEHYDLTFRQYDEVTVEYLYDSFVSDMRDVKISKRRFGLSMGLLGFKSAVSNSNKRVYKGLKEKTNQSIVDDGIDS